MAEIRLDASPVPPVVCKLSLSVTGTLCCVVALARLYGLMLTLCLLKTRFHYTAMR